MHFIFIKRVNEEDNTVFIKQMEKYFYRESVDYYKGIYSPDFKPEVFYQIGATPEYVEKARYHCDRYKDYPEEDRPISECPPIYDSKWRFFWQIGERNKDLDDGMLMNDNIIPEGFPHWEKTMNSWGNHMLEGCNVVAEMAAIGVGLPQDSFTEKMKYSGHLLAPTGSDLGKFQTGDIFAGVHYGKILY